MPAAHGPRIEPAPDEAVVNWLTEQFSARIPKIGPYDGQSLLAVTQILVGAAATVHDQVAAERRGQWGYRESGKNAQIIVRPLPQACFLEKL